MITTVLKKVSDKYQSNSLGLALGIGDAAERQSEVSIVGMDIFPKKEMPEVKIGEKGMKIVKLKVPDIMKNVSKSEYDGLLSTIDLLRS